MRNKTYYVEEINEYDFCGTKFLYLKGRPFEKPFAIKRADGEHTTENCKGCEKQYNNIVESVKASSIKFPNCCEGHKKLNHLDQFKKSDFIDLENSVADKILFTYQFVINHIENEDFFEDFTNYFDYVSESFGSFPQDHGSPFLIGSYYGFIEDLITNQVGKLKSNNLTRKEIDGRLNQITDFIKQSTTAVEVKSIDNENFGFNLLLSTYDKWYKTFPFELSYFAHLKVKFSKTIPIIKNKPCYNKYTGLVKAKLHTKESLSQFLFGLTKEIISTINGLRLYEKGILTNVQSIKLELILKNRELEISELNSTDKSDNKGYIRVLKHWFKTEKKFIDEITPILNDSVTDTQKEVNSARPNRTDLAYFIYYMETTKNKILINRFPSDKAWKELGKKYNRNAKNIQVTYNSIFNSQSERLNKSRVNNISYVIENMLNDFETAQNLAKDELTLAELNS